jgi:hypothetical protein
MWRHIADAVRELRRNFERMFDPYRPELHYMRGPGPKWRAKRAGASTAAAPTAAESAALREMADAHA